MTRPRVLVVHPGPHFSVADVYSGWVKALSKVSDVETFDLGDWLNLFHGFKKPPGDNDSADPGEWVNMFTDSQLLIMGAKHLEAKLYEWWPDIVVVISGFFVPLDILDMVRTRGHKVVMVHTESPYEDHRQLSVAEHVDLNILNDPTNLERFRQLAPSEYFCHAYDPDVHRPGGVGKDYRSEVCFVGTGYPSRIKFLEAVDWSGIDLALGGHWQTLADDSPLRPYMAHDIEMCMDNAEAVKAYQGTLASFNLYRCETSTEHDDADGWSVGPREIEMAACGTWFARQSRPEGDELFPMLPTFTTPAELGWLLRWAIDHPEERAELAAAARAAVADRTFDAHAVRLLGLI